MPTAMIDGEVLTRRTVQFKDRKTNEDVVYHEAVLFHPEEKTFSVVRSTDKTLIEPYVPGTAMEPHEVTVRPERGSVPATLVKPLSDNATGNTGAW